MGGYLMFCGMASLSVSSALWLTATSANPIGVSLAAQAGVKIAFGTWLLASSVPALATIILLPVILSRLFPPGVTETPNAPALARKELHSMGRLGRHEWIGISAAWDETPTVARAVYLIDKISRYHLAEEFCHMRLFQEMFRTFGLDGVEWGPLPKRTKQLYGAFARLPGPIVAPPAFVSELMGLTVYLQLDAMLDEIVGDEHDVRDRIRELLRAIMTDELSHVGERRNFMGPVGLRAAKLMVRPMFRAFFGGIPEAPLLFDTRRMRKDAEAFDYSTIRPDILKVSWAPSYCTPRP